MLFKCEHASSTHHHHTLVSVVSACEYVKVIGNALHDRTICFFSTMHTELTLFIENVCVCVCAYLTSAQMGTQDLLLNLLEIK